MTIHDVLTSELLAVATDEQRELFRVVMERGAVWSRHTSVTYSVYDYDTGKDVLWLYRDTHTVETDRKAPPTRAMSKEDREALQWLTDRIVRGNG